MVPFLPQETFPQVLLTAHLNLNGLGKAVISWNSEVTRDADRKS